MVLNTPLSYCNSICYYKTNEHLDNKSLRHLDNEHYDNRALPSSDILVKY